MDLTHTLRRGLVSRRQALAFMAAMAAVRGAGAAEPGMLQPATLDHVNIRVSNAARSAQFYMALFDTPVLRNPALRARPNVPPGEAYFLKMGEGYLVVSQAFSPDIPGLDHYSVGMRNYEQGTLAARLKDNGFAGEARSADIWVRDLDASIIQLRTTGGWARQSAAPMPRPSGGPSLLPLSMSRIGIRSADLARAGDFYGRLYGTELASAASNRSRMFSLGDSVLELVSVPAGSGVGIDHIRVAVKDFNAETVRRMLRERAIDLSDGAAPGLVRISDPDGIGIEIAAAS
jgi:catechol 2,3-dioxygenase-like lactoylglutathione lyase family enzyme